MYVRSTTRQEVVTLELRTSLLLLQNVSAVIGKTVTIDVQLTVSSILVNIPFKQLGRSWEE